MRVPEIDPQQQHPRLLCVDLTARLIGRPRPRKTSPLQPLHPQTEPRPIPVHRFQHPPLRVADVVAPWRTEPAPLTIPDGGRGAGVPAAAEHRPRRPIAAPRQPAESADRWWLTVVRLSNRAGLTVDKYINRNQLQDFFRVGPSGACLSREEWVFSRVMRSRGGPTGGHGRISHTES